MADRKGSKTRDTPGTRDVRGAARVGRGGQFVAPPPRGVRLAEPIPKSTKYVAPDPDPDEEAAFVEREDSGRVRSGSRKARRGEPEMSAARRRMVGPQADEDEAEDVTDPQPTGPVKVQSPAEPVRHPISPFAPVPPATVQSGPLDAIHSSVVGLYCRPVGLEDTDRLWDWIRGDKDFGRAFLGRTYSTSLTLHDFMQKMADAERAGIAIIRAIQYHEHHLGFAMLAPILAPERTALMHIYLQPAVRNQLASFVAPLVEIARKVAPGVHLAVASADEANARLHRQVLKPLGFIEHVMFVL